MLHKGGHYDPPSNFGASQLLNSINNAAEVIGGNKDQKAEKEMELNSIAAAIWRPWV